jgi:hypothetical protein
MFPQKSHELALSTGDGNWVSTSFGHPHPRPFSFLGESEGRTERAFQTCLEGYFKEGRNERKEGEKEADFRGTFEPSFSRMPHS